jgi:hypothetical protein
MPIPYPPPGCKTAYIQNSRALVVPEGASLPPICVQCGLPSNVVVKTTFHWPQPDPELRGNYPRSPSLTPLLQEIGFLFRWIFRLDTRVTLDVPLCSQHHGEEKFCRWLGAMMFIVGLVLLPLIFIAHAAPDWRQTSTWIGVYVLLFGGTSLAFSGMNTLHVVEVNTAFSAYKGFGAEFMMKMPHEVKIFPPKYGTAFAPAAGADRREPRTTPTLSADHL